MKPEPFELQHDDHIWLTVNGEAWAIAAINRPFIMLWRGYLPDLEFNLISMQDFDAEDYCDKAVALLYG
jgi:hypothetical protein